MFFVFPIGHDQPFYERPWLTISLILSCTVALGVTSFLESAATQELDLAVAETYAVLEANPGARISFEVDGMPEAVAAEIRPMIDARPGRRLDAGDLALEDAVRRVVAALNRFPSLAWGFRPGRPSVVRAFVHMFLHAGFFHLAGNMLLLWVAGGILECFWRRWAYLLLYVGSGLLGLLAHSLTDLDSLTPVVGASGAVSGLLGAFLVGYPHTKIRLFYAYWFFRPSFGTTERAAWVVIPLWAGLELVNALVSSGSGVAHWAHVGGFVSGAIAAVIAKKMLWIAEDAGITRAPAEVQVESLPKRREGFFRDAAPSVPPPCGEDLPKAPPMNVPSRPPPPAIELSSLPPDDDDFSLR